MPRAPSPPRRGRATPPPSPPSTQEEIADERIARLARSLRAAIRRGRLLLHEELLDEFAADARILPELLDPFITIRDPEVRVIEAEPGIIGIPGANIVDDDGLITPGRSRVQVRGDATVLGIPVLRVILDLFIVRFQPRYALVLAPVPAAGQDTAVLGLESIFPSIPIVRDLALTGPHFVLTNQTVLYDPNRDAGIAAGLNFYGNFTINPSDAEIAADVEETRLGAPAIPREPPRELRAVGGLLGVNDLAIHLAVFRENASSGQAPADADGAATSGGAGSAAARGPLVFLAEAAVQRTLPALGDARVGFIMRYTRSDVAIQVKGSPPEPALTISHDIVVSLNEHRIWPVGQLLADAIADVAPITGPAVAQIDQVIADTRPEDRWTHLVFTGAIRLEPESITGSFTLNGTGRSADGALTGNSPNPSVWQSPFGIPGVEIRQLALQLGGTYAPPWLDSVGCAGNLRVGGLDGSIAVLVDTNDPDNYVLSGTVADISVIEIMITLLAALPPNPPGLALLAYQALPEAITGPLERVVGVRMQEVQITIVPAPTSIGGIFFREPGIIFAGTLVIFGWRASARVVVDYVDGISARGDMDPYTIDGVLALRGAGEDPAPQMRLRIGPTSDPNFSISGMVTLLGLSASLLCRIDRAGLVFAFVAELPGTLQVELQCTLDDRGLRARGLLRFDLDLTIPSLQIEGVEVLPEIDLRGVMLDADLDLFATQSPSFSLTVRGAVAHQGTRRAFPPLRVDVPPEDFAALRDAIREHIEREALRIFRGVVNLSVSPHADLAAPRLDERLSEELHADVPAQPGVSRRATRSVHADVPHANVSVHANRGAHLDVGFGSRRIHADVRSPHGDVARRSVSQHADVHGDAPGTPALSRQAHADQHGDVAPPHLDQAPHLDLGPLFDRLGGIEMEMADMHEATEPAGDEGEG